MQEKECKPASKAEERVGWALACFGFLALLAMPAYFQIKQNREALGWPTVSGRVVSSSMSESYNAEAGDTSYYFDVTYEYQVGARHLSGSSSLGPLSGSRAEEWVEAYPPGSWVRVYYNPRDPQRSAVWPEVHSRVALIELIGEFLAPMAVFGLFSLWSWVSKGARRKSSATVA